MAQALVWKFDEQAEQIFIHFDVPDHYLSLDTFIQTADSARKIVEALDRTLFDGSSDFEVIVLPPSEGTFGEWLGIHPKKKLSVAAIAVFLCTPQGEALTKGLTGQTTSEWFEDAGVAIRQGIEEAVDYIGAEEGPPEEHLLDDASSEAVAEAACEVATRMVTSMTRGILELGTDALNKIGVGFGALPDAMDARAEFYEACMNNVKVRGLGFTPEEDFPIPRNSFPERAQKPARKKEEEPEPEWLVSSENIYVNSPNWNEDKQSSRKWQGIDSSRRERLFVIEDAEFWGRIKRKELLFEGLDSLKVEWAYQLEDRRLKHHRVLRVLEFNGTKLAEPLTPDAIAAILGSYSKVEASRDGPSLLDFMDE
jgi:hypothetical protein